MKFMLTILFLTEMLFYYSNFYWKLLNHTKQDLSLNLKTLTKLNLP